MSDRDHTDDDAGSTDDEPTGDGARDGSGTAESLVEDAGEEPTDPNQLLEEIEHKRSLRGPAVVAVATVGILFSAFQLWFAARGATFEFTVPGYDTVRLARLQRLQFRAVHVTFALILAFLMYPPTSGDGAVARRLGRLPALARERLGDGAVVSGLERLRAAAAWAVVDRDRDRVTPADLALVVLSILPTAYYIVHFQEVESLRSVGIGNGDTLAELYPSLEPVAVGPFATEPVAYLLGILAILVVLEATRRALGTLLLLVVTVFIIYGRFGFMIARDAPVIGRFALSELRWDQIVQQLWYTGEGILGTPVDVSVRFIYIFILFGAFLEMSGAGKWFIDLAYSATGTRTGGPAKASVVASGFMGMISGSSVANTVTTGALTIPLMKRSGYSAKFAGAVEASVSSGGQILPPVMGAAAFLIVEFTGTPYRTVIIAATVPALMFFFGMWVMVHLEAARRGIGGLPRSELLDVGSHLRRGWFYLAPIVLLLYYLVVLRYSIGRSGWYTIVAIVALMAVVAAYDRRSGPYLVGAIAAAYGAVAVSYALTGGHPIDALTGAAAGGGLAPLAALRAAASHLGVVATVIGVLALLIRRGGEASLLDLDDSVDQAAAYVDDRLGRSLATTRPGRFGSFVLKSMDSGARTATIVVVAVAAAGVIPGIIGLTGLPGTLRALIIAVSGGSFVLLLLLAGISSLVVGMGMPTTVMYIVIVVLLGPTLGEFGVVLLATHLFVLYWGLMADVTPPVAVAAFAGAGVARADPMETGVQAFLLSLNKVLVPFAFIFAPGILLLRGSTEGGEPLLVGWSDLADPGYFLPEVAVPILAVFAGVYALGVAIIGFYRGPVGSVGRVGYAVSALLLSVPGMLLTPGGTALGLLGMDVTLYTLGTDLATRGVGAALFAGLLLYNARTGAEPDEPSGTDAATTSAD